MKERRYIYIYTRYLNANERLPKPFGGNFIYRGKAIVHTLFEANEDNTPERKLDKYKKQFNKKVDIKTPVLLLYSKHVSDVSY